MRYEGIDSLVYNWSDKTSSFTDEMIEDLKDTVLNKFSKDYGY